MRFTNRLHILRVEYHTLFAELLLKRQVASFKKRKGFLSRLRYFPIYLFTFLATLTFLPTETKEDRINKAFSSKEVAVNEEKSQDIEKSSSRKEIDLGTFLATGYTSHPSCTGEWTDGYTATGVKARYGIVAVDPKVIPLKSKLWVEGYGYCRAEDTGRLINGRKIDLYFNTYWEAKRYGKKRVKVKIIQES